MRIRNCSSPYDLYTLHYNIPDENLNEFIPRTQVNLDEAIHAILSHNDLAIDRSLPVPYDEYREFLYYKKWMELITGKQRYLRKHGFIPVSYDPVTKQFQVITPQPGRPPAKCPKARKIDFRLEEEIAKQLDIYCRTNNIGVSEAIRRGLGMLLAIEKNSAE